MASRDIALLHPELRQKCELFLLGCQKAKLPVFITCTGRTLAEQAALFAQGRKPLSIVNEMRVECGLYVLAPEENKRKVTWTMQSLHIIDPTTGYCSAFDFALRDENEKAHWNLKVDVNNNEVMDYQEAGLIALEVGLEWGGTWKTPDYPHCQLRA